MKIDSMRDRLLASSMICGVAFLALSAAPAAAQQASEEEVAEVVVTGTRIPSPNLTSVAPVTSIGSADIKAQGITKIEDMVNTLPQAFAAQGSTYSNGSNGTATVNLRGLGSSRTVVLIDGRRLQAGNPTSSIVNVAADLNFIPSSLVERVDVLTGGASAVYGADAVAGVVNFIMTKNFEGVRLDAQYSIYQHNQHDDEIQGLVLAKRATASVPSQFSLPKDNIRDGESSQVTLTMGVSAPDGKGNITAYATYLHQEPILGGERDFSSCTLNSGATFGENGCGGSGTAFPARVGSFLVDPNGPGNTFRARNAATDVYNFGPLNYFIRPDDRYGLGAFAHYELAPWATAYADLMFMEDSSTYQIAPGGIFASSGPQPGGLFAINCDNPLLTTVQQTQLCGTAAGTPVTRNFNVARRNIEGGGRQGHFRHTEYRYVVGLKGDFNDDWSYDAYLQYGTTSLVQIQTGFFITSRIQNALLVGRNAQGQPACQVALNGSDPACVPYNIFSLNSVTPAALNYLSSPAYSSGNITERVANVSFVGQLPETVMSPWAQDRVGVSFGAEYRREHLDFAADFVQSAGLLNGGGGASPPVDGGYDVYEVFSEARVPLIQDKPFFKDSTLELAYRFSDYSNAGVTHTYKVSGDWSPMDGLRLRAGYNRAVRAPNVVELFSPTNVVLDGTVDPCAGLTAGNPLVARCAQLFNLTTAQVLAIEPDPASQYNGRTGGNPNLDPETADTYTLGVVYRPTFLPGFDLSVDWFSIKVKDFIGTIGADTIINGCVLQNNLNNYCSLVVRDALGGIKSPQGFVIDTTFNTGALKTSGVDITAGYRSDLDRFGMEGMGSVNFSFVGTFLDKLATQPLPGDDYYDCAGYYGTICSNVNPPSPEWRHKFRATWNTPLSYGDWLSDLALSVQWRHIGHVTLDSYSDNPALNNPDRQFGSEKRFPNFDYIDLSASWTMRETVKFRLGVNNVFDKNPPLSGQGTCPTGVCSNNTWPQTYDALGRYIYFGLVADF